MGEMQDVTATARGIDRDAQSQLNPNQVSIRDLWEWAAPWISRGVFIVIGVGGLLFASGSRNHTEFWAGFATAVLAVLIFALRLKRDFDGHRDGFLPDIWITRVETLWLFLPAMVFLGIAGAIVAASTQNAVLYFGGITLFVVCAGLAFMNAARCIGGGAYRQQPRDSSATNNFGRGPQ